MLKDKALTALQRDRLSSFLKESINTKSGCFFYSLLMCWEQINPNKILSRTTAQRILDLDKTLGVLPSDLLQKVADLEDLLQLKVVKIEVPSWVNQTAEEIRRDFSFPPDIPIEKDLVTSNIAPIDHNSSAIIYWQKDDNLAHYTSLFLSTRFEGQEIENGNIGGQEGANFVQNEGFLSTLVFHVSSTTPHH